MPFTASGTTDFELCFTVSGSSSDFSIHCPSIELAPLLFLPPIDPEKLLREFRIRIKAYRTALFKRRQIMKSHCIVRQAVAQHYHRKLYQKRDWNNRQVVPR